MTTMTTFNTDIFAKLVTSTPIVEVDRCLDTIAAIWTVIDENGTEWTIDAYMSSDNDDISFDECGRTDDGVYTGLELTLAQSIFFKAAMKIEREKVWAQWDKEDAEEDAALADAEEYAKDPYAYNGVKRSDFF